MKNSSTSAKILYVAFVLFVWHSTCHYAQCQNDNAEHHEKNSAENREENSAQHHQGNSAEQHEENSAEHHEANSPEQREENSAQHHNRDNKKHHNGDLHPFTSPTGRFSVLFQGRPEYEKVTNNNLISNRYAHAEGDNRYFVSFADLPGAPESTKDLQIWLNRYCPLSAQNVGGRITATYSVQLAGKIPGRQLEGSTARGVFRMRIFLVGNRLYEMYIGGTKDYVNSPVVSEFLNSLTVTR
jgi:hypothetical protein